ncbi:bacterial Ig-like domain-containing protein [Treponema sp.]|uniref:Ig-like domain-containing protein n=1 Tax=Treponema sp. TaxID=166 RepID=UPI0025E2BE4F|nr:bacterial Ig-like domain-containing protein [Treponema sp.]MBR4321501.1 bacterial Ig-like domain-containing protein [Treponema sp.]
MKKLRFVKALFAAAVLTLAIPGCSDFDGSESTGTVQTQGNKIALRISAGNGYERTAIPDAEQIKLSEYTYDLFKVDGEEKVSLFGKGAVSYNDLISGNIVYIEAGTYTFSLVAYKDNAAILGGTLANKTISETDNTLSFKLFALEADSLDATVSISVKVPAGYGAASVSAEVKAASNITTEAAKSFNLSAVEGDSTALTATVTGNVPSGNSSVVLSVRDSNGEEIAGDTVIVYAVKGITSYDSRAISLSKYKAAVNVTTDATTAPAVTLKNKKIADAAVITLTTESSASPFAYSGYVPMGEYDVFVNGDVHGSLTNTTAVSVDTNLTLQSISAAWKNETQPVFYVGASEAEILSELVVTGTYKDEYNNVKTQTISSGYSLSGYDAAKTDTVQNVKVAYSGKESGEISITLTPVVVKTIALVKAPSKTTYKLGESLDLAGLIIKPTMNNGDDGEDVAYSTTTEADFAATGFASTEVAANKTVTITYKTIATATATFDAKIIALDKIEITTQVTKTEYKTGDDLDLTGMVVKASYTDGTTSGLNEADVTSAVSTSGYSKTADGEQTITVSYTEGSGENAITKTATFKVTVAHVFTETMTLDFTGSSPAGKTWNGVPIRGSGNVAALVTRTEGSFAGYLGRKFWLVDGVYAEYCNSAAGLGYTNSEKDTTHESTDFVKAIESEAIGGPFKLTVKTNTKEREFRIYVSADKTTLWTSNPVVAENLSANSGTHTFEFTGTEPVYIGIGTLPASDKTVYSSISSILLETDTAIPADSFPATGIAFTNSGIENGALTLTKDSIPEDGYQLTTTVTPDYASDKTISFSVTGNTKVSVSETGLVTAASDMSTNETVTITAKANGGSDVTATLSLTVKAEADPADKVSTTVNELKTALNAAGSSFSYGNTAAVVNNAKTFIGTLTLTYSDVEITPSLDATTGKLTFTIKNGDVTDDSLTVEYTENLANAAVAEAVSEVKAKLANVAWKTDAATTKNAVEKALAGVVLTDAELSIETVSTEDNGDTVVVTIKNTVKGSGETAISVTDSSIVYESPKFEVTDGVLNLLAKKYEYYLSFDSVTSKTGDDAWTSTTSSVSKDGRNGTEVFKTTFTGFDFKKSATITLKFAGVAKLALWIKGNAGKTFKVGNTTYQLNLSDSVGNSGNTPAAYNTGDNWRFDIEFSDASSVQSFVMTAGESSIYPLGVILYAPTGEATGINATENLPASDITLAQDSSNSNKFTVTGTPVETAGSTITWYVNDVVQTAGTSQTSVADDTFTLSGTLGTIYEVRVDVTANGITYSQTESVMYK